MPSQNFTPAILVTGSSGQLGSEIKFLSKNFSAFKFVFTSREELPIENSKSLQSFFGANKIDYCINCAAYTAVDKAESEKEKAYSINADAVGDLARACFENQTKLIHISTDYVYDGSSKIPLKENGKLAPINVYGLSKLKGEELALNNNPSTLIIRTSWVYSSFGNNFVKTMLRLFNDKAEINVINDQLGSPTYAADIADVIMQMTSKIEEGSSINGILNYCNSGVTNWYGFAEEIKFLANSKCKINPIPTSSYKTAAKRPPYSVLDTSKIQALLHLNIPHWKDSLKKCIEMMNQ